MVNYGSMTSDGVTLSDLYKEFHAALDWYRIEKFAYKQNLMQFIPLGKDTKTYLKSFEMQDIAEMGKPDFQQQQMSTIAAPDTASYGMANAYTLEAIEESRSDDLRRVHGHMMEADREKIIKLLLTAMMTSGSNGFYDGSLSVAPPGYGHNTFATTEDHYLASGSATIALDDLTEIKRHIRHHGVKDPLLLFINSAEVKAMEDLAGWTTAMTRVGFHETISKSGFDPVGHILGFNVVQTEWCPAGYLLGVVNAGITLNKPVAYSEPETKNIHGQSVPRGLHLLPGSTEEPLIDAKYRHRIGMKVFHRDAGVAMKITAGSWSNPTF